MGKTLEEFHFGLKGLPFADVAFCYSDGVVFCVR